MHDFRESANQQNYCTSQVKLVLCKIKIIADSLSKSSITQYDKVSIFTLDSLIWTQEYLPDDFPVDFPVDFSCLTFPVKYLTMTSAPLKLRSQKVEIIKQTIKHPDKKG